MGSHIQKQTAETDIDYRIAKAMQQINIGNTLDISRVAGIPRQKIANRAKILKKYGVLAGDRTGYRPGPEFDSYYNFYAKRYKQF